MCVCVRPGDADCLTDVHLSKLSIVSIQSIRMGFTCQLFLVKVLVSLKKNKFYHNLYYEILQTYYIKMYYII